MPRIGMVEQWFQQARNRRQERSTSFSAGSLRDRTLGPTEGDVSTPTPVHEKPLTMKVMHSVPSTPAPEPVTEESLRRKISILDRAIVDLQQQAATARAELQQFINKRPWWKS